MEQKEGENCPPESLTTLLAKNITLEEFLADSPQVKKKLKDLETVHSLTILAVLQGHSLAKMSRK